MSKVYFITGSLGAGKTMAGVNLVKQYLEKGKRVATNVNLFTEQLTSANDTHSKILRIPDSPTIDHLRAIGLGSPEQADYTHGLLLLDELGTWFNARDFSNKGRLEIIKWCIHMRKRRWDVAFIVQDFTMVDKQIRGNIAQYLVLCKSSKEFFLFKPFPKFHIGTVMHLQSKRVVENWFYTGKRLHNSYDTEQLFHTGEDDDIADSDAEMSAAEARSKEKNGLYCLLPCGYLPPEQQKISTDLVIHHNSRRKKLGFVILSLPILVLAYLFVPVPASDVDALSPNTDQQISTSQITENTPPGQLPPEPQLEEFDVSAHLKIHTYTILPGRINIRLTDGHNIYSPDDFTSLGFDVIPETRNTIVLQKDDQRWVIR
ncbi:MAG: zonular occludens toxin domain-containing protein [Pseudohongiella sp.]|nr:zonular occludens toxin domain-containing protein [Pseudohongiella sp.]